jgi:hypothetical protein
VLEVDAWIASAEDTIVAKLEWSMRGASERQLRDVAGIIAMQGAGLDMEYIERWARELGVIEQWAAVHPDDLEGA